MSTSQPFFCVVLHDSDKWVIEAEWPDGSIEPIDTFSEHFEATKTIPIVFAVHADPVGIGHVASLARPGGNITGLPSLLTELSVKELEILKEAVPHAMRIGVLWAPTTPSHQPALKAVEAAGGTLGVQLVTVPPPTVEGLDEAFSFMRQERVSAFLCPSSPLFFSQRAHIAELAISTGCPGCSEMWSMSKRVV
jgi:putative ABC transport system substrate-binding protein